MRETVKTSELDLALVNALQIRPRASWAELAPPLGVTASTLARRWTRLARAGLAWVSAVPGPEYLRHRCTAFVSVDCRPGSRSEVITALSRYSEIATIETTVSGTDLLLDVLAPDLHTLGRFLTTELEQVNDITSVSAVLATSLYFGGDRWQLQSLEPAQRATLASNRAQPKASPGSARPDHTLLEQLVCDGRMTWLELSQRTGLSTATARRRVDGLTASGLITFRCDLADSMVSWPVPVTFFAQAPANEVHDICRTLAALPETRLVATVTGSANIFTTLWLRNIGDIQRMEIALRNQLPTLAVTQRVVGLRTVKRMGHLFDQEGCRDGVQPIAPW